MASASFDRCVLKCLALQIRAVGRSCKLVALYQNPWLMPQVRCWCITTTHMCKPSGPECSGLLASELPAVSRTEDSADQLGRSSVSVTWEACVTTQVLEPSSLDVACSSGGYNVAVAGRGMQVLRFSEHSK